MPEDYTLPTDTPEANARQERRAEVSPFSEPPSGVLGPQRARRVPGIGAETGNLQATAAMMILTSPLERDPCYPAAAGATSPSPAASSSCLPSPPSSTTSSRCSPYAIPPIHVRTVRPPSRAAPTASAVSYSCPGLRRRHHRSSRRRPPGALGPPSASWSTLTVSVPVPAPASAARARASAATSSTANTDDPLCSGPGYDLWAVKALPRRDAVATARGHDRSTQALRKRVDELAEVRFVKKISAHTANAQLRVLRLFVHFVAQVEETSVLETISNFFTPDVATPIPVSLVQAFMEDVAAATVGRLSKRKLDDDSDDELAFPSPR
ncbi:hypothetical protein MVLG_00683 [Microbotryum lychnidis-dioicae p1A1 Lamole]|uniref:Uncharacterized protein n=1 Tax=Microbotryum lychnidis-dioicae (strain p1A1 Lamole / MvSl-1064) TaxID=683840 RepID=U5GZT7_USTV1|nr:hypothetical protein MVLG_00683 [Microbotryum lychnidis-dioicae p1A1 Lamole]|eukprot:KDE08959.1 hypothetical protein MVLG_00683 [Microbotryum lychnidis-dioicae p1A1 Lamole]